MATSTTDPATAERRTQAERREAAEDALLDAATRLFAERGVEATSMADIGAAAGFSRGLANHRFGTRAALVEQLAHRVHRYFAKAADASGLTGIDALIDLTRRYLGATLADDDGQVTAFFVMWGASFPGDAQLRPVFVAFDERSRASIRGLIRSGQATGEIRDDVDVDAFATVLLGTLRGVATQHLLAPNAGRGVAAGGVDIEAAARFVEHLIHTHLTVDRTATDSTATDRTDADPTE